MPAARGMRKIVVEGNAVSDELKILRIIINGVDRLHIKHALCFPYISCFNLQI